MMRVIVAVLLTLGIPFFLFVGVWQSSRYKAVERSVVDYEREQYRLIEENKRKISGIAILLRNERIEKIARDSLKMKKASSDRIVRIEIDRDISDQKGFLSNKDVESF